MIETEIGPFTSDEGNRRWRGKRWEGWDCTYCGQPAMCGDHVRPRSVHGEGAVVPACFNCNGQKGKKELADWLAGLARSGACSYILDRIPSFTTRGFFTIDELRCAIGRHQESIDREIAALEQQRDRLAALEAGRS